MKNAILVMVLAPVFVCGCRKQEAAKQEPAKQESAQRQAPQPSVEQSAPAAPESPKWERKGDFIIAFGGVTLAPTRRDPHVSYGFDPNVERFFVHVPEDYTGETAYGLIVFTDADSDSRQLPEGWQAVLDQRKFLYIAAQAAGNDQYSNRRLGLAVLGALEMMKHYRVDPSRVYAAGFSGGARMAGLLGFYQADLFHGTIQNCGADFYKPVPTQAATSTVDTAGNPYGLFDATADEITSARSVRFALITGSRDFRHGNILDIFNGGFAAEGFKAKLFDVPGMPHDTADAQTLSAAIDFIEP
jgi:Esterase PHB depolymerase